MQINFYNLKILILIAVLLIFLVMIFLMGKKIDALEEKINLPEISQDKIYAEMSHCILSGGTYSRYFMEDKVVEKCEPKE